MVPEIWSATDRIFVILDHFLPLYPSPPKQPKKSNFKNEEIPAKKLSFYTCMVPEIESTTERIFCHFGLLFAL